MIMCTFNYEWYKCDNMGEFTALKKIALALCFVAFAVSVSAQDKKFDYQGEVALGIDYADSDVNVGAELVNGIRFSRNFSAGVGFGMLASTSDEAVIVPLFVDLKSYWPVANKLDLLFGVDMGTKLDYAYDMSGGFLFRPEFGLAIKLGERYGLNLAFRYSFYSYRTDVLIGNASNLNVQVRTNHIGFKIGFVF